MKILKNRLTVGGKNVALVRGFDSKVFTAFGWDCEKLLEKRLYFNFDILPLSSNGYCRL